MRTLKKTHTSQCRKDLGSLRNLHVVVVISLAPSKPGLEAISQSISLSLSRWLWKTHTSKASALTQMPEGAGVRRKDVQRKTRGWFSCNRIKRRLGREAAPALSESNRALRDWRSVQALCLQSRLAFPSSAPNSAKGLVRKLYFNLNSDYVSQSGSVTRYRSNE